MFTNWWEWAVFVTGVVTVLLVVRQNIWNWPLGMLNSALLFVVAVDAKLYSDGGLQIVYIVLGGYGWWHWLYGNPLARDALPVSRTPHREALIIVLVAVVGYVALGLLLDHGTDTDVPWYDAFPTTASLVAQYLLTRKYLENWPVWIVLVNIPYIALYAYKDLPLLSGLQLLYIALSVAGWVSWRKAMAEHTARGVGVVMA